jgi:hypothetical protein
MPHGMVGRQSSAGCAGRTGGGVKIIGLPLSAGGRIEGALHKSTSAPDWPPNAGMDATTPNAITAGASRIGHPPRAQAAILALEGRGAMAI